MRTVSSPEFLQELGRVSVRCSEDDAATVEKALSVIIRLRAVIEQALHRNGGPIGSENTWDGNEYVMVLREDFEALSASLLV